MVKKEKAFQVPPRSLFDIAAVNDTSQLCISVKGINPHDSSPGSLVLSQKQRPVTSDGMTTVGSTGPRAMVAPLTAGMVAFERDAGGFTALHIAASHGHEDMVRTLVEEYHCDINATSDAGSTPLYVAAEQGHEDIVSYLLAQPGIEVKTVTRELKSVVTIAAEKQHHSISVRVDEALKAAGYNTEDIDPLEAALQGDLAFFVIEKSRMESAAKSVHGGNARSDSRYTRIAFALDPARNCIPATIASQRSIVKEQVAVVEYILANKICGDINAPNSVQNTALHNLAISCGEREVGESLNQRIALLKLLLKQGADVNRKNGAGQIPSQLTENAILKLFFGAAEKKETFLASYVRRNQIPAAERAQFAVACKDLKKAYRHAEVAAENALKDPRSVIPPASNQSSPKSSPREPGRGGAMGSSSKIHIAVMEALNLPPQSDAFAVLTLRGQVVLQTEVVPESTNPKWKTAAVEQSVAVGDELVVSVFDKDMTANALLGETHILIAEQHLQGMSTLKLPLGTAAGSEVVVSITAE